MTMDMLPEQKKLAETTTKSTIQVAKVYEANCEQNKNVTYRYKATVKNIALTMLHHKYSMELFSLNASSLNCEMSE